MEKIILTCPKDVADFIPSMTGYQPDEAVAVLGLGGGGAFAACAEINSFTAQPSQVAQALKRNGADSAIFVVYARDDAVAQRAANAILDTAVFDGTEIVDALRVVDAKHIYSLDSAEYLGEFSGTPMQTRADIVAEADTYDDALKAEYEMVKAYRAGDGGRAWIFHDRCAALGHGNVMTSMVAELLTTAAGPQSLPDDVRTLLDSYLAQN